MRVTCRIFLKSMAIVFFAGLLIIAQNHNVTAFDLGEVVAIGTAYSTHIFLHEVGHQVVADEVGADSSHMSFFTFKQGKFYPGLSTSKGIPEESVLSHAAGGESMATYTFEYALDSYRRSPTTFNKSLLFFTCVDFVLYTVMSNYITPDDETYDPTIIRDETGCSKELFLSLVLAKSMVNTYRIYNQDANIVPMILIDRNSAALVFQFSF